MFLLLIFILACNNKNETGENVIVCPEKPLKGTVELEIEKVLTIDSLAIDDAKPPLFEFIAKDREGNLFIGSNRPAVRVYKFGMNGQLSKEFLRKGEGPGELRGIHVLQHIDNSIMVSSDTKTVEYDTDGHYISEKRFKKQYGSITFIDKQNFIANYYKVDKNDNSNSRRICSIINKNSEEVVVDLLKFDRENIGMTIVKDNEGKTVFTFSLSGITPDYDSLFCQDNKLIYQCLTSEPQLYIKNKNGDLIKTIRRNFKKWIFTKNDKDKQTASFKRLPGAWKKLLKRNLPEEMAAISDIKLLPKGYFAVSFYKNFDEHEICIFNEAGEFRYIIEFPIEPVIMLTKFTKTGFAAIHKSEDRDVYIEYKITNLPEIFNN